MTDWPAFVAELGGVPVVTDPTAIKRKSRDFYWYSPVLRRALDGVCADLVVLPRNEAEVVRTMRLCHRRRVPLTVRAGGTGNYGQAMPLRGGVVLDVSGLDRIKAIGRGRVVAEAGTRLIDIDRACQAHSDQELRFHPSTIRHGTIGGFIAGGSSGVGSITWGLLRDRGNILGLRVVTMEAEPRILELRGDAIQKVNHAYGTNGVITEVEMPLATAWPWVDLVAGFGDLAVACRFAQSLGEHDGIVKKLLTPIAAPIPQRYFRAFRSFIPDGRHVVLVMVAEASLEALVDLLVTFGGDVLYRRPTAEPGPPGPLYEYSWNHTTLHALRVEPSITYLQTMYPAPDHLDLVEHMGRHFGDEVTTHLEFVRFGGQVGCLGLPLVRFTTEARLAEIIAYHEARGCPVFNPHAYTLEEGGMKQVDRPQLLFKREADPLGLMNPGKMLAWEDPTYDPGPPRVHLYPGAREGPCKEAR